MDAPYGGFLPVGGVVRRVGRSRHLLEAVGRPRLEEVDVLFATSGVHCWSGSGRRRSRSPAVRADYEVSEVLLDGEPANRRVGGVRLERRPVRAIVERHVERVLDAKVEQPRPGRIFADAVRVAQGVLESRRDVLPGLSVVGRLEDVGVAVVDLWRSTVM